MLKDKILKEVHFFNDKNIFPMVILKKELGQKANPLGVPIHFHKEIEINYFQKGHTIYKIGNKIFPVNEECIIIIPQNREHSCMYSDSTKDKLDTFIFDLDFMFQCSQNIIDLKYIETISNEIVSLPNYIPKTSTSFKELVICLKKIEQNLKDKNLGYELFIKSEIFTFIAILYRDGYILENKQNGKLNKEGSIKKTYYSYIQNNYKNTISREDICKEFGISNSQFSRSFKKETGFTFVEYLNSYRLYIAIHLLVSTNMSITQIALEVGFQDLSYFIRSFIKKYEVTPSKYRVNYFKNK